jgi:hypothetical protein
MPKETAETQSLSQFRECFMKGKNYTEAVEAYIKMH